jgi:hypothetical protein
LYDAWCVAGGLHLSDNVSDNGRRSEIRILHIFDPERNAVLLASGDKAGKSAA